MPFIPHIETDIKQMLDTIGVATINDLFNEIPAHLKIAALPTEVPTGVTEMELMQQMQKRAAQDNVDLCFIGAGAYEHHIPAAVWDITTRGEFMTAYTPYQAEASQGTLQLLYEYQTMMASLTGLDVSNASLYDGATAVAEAVLMAVRANRKSKSNKVLVAGTLNPNYQQVIHTTVSNQDIELVSVPYCATSGRILFNELEKFTGQDFAALIISQPNFFGVIEDVDSLTDWAHQNNLLTIAVVNPTALALLKEPGRWGQQGADIACGEGQPLGVPLASGGPYFGFITCRQSFVRQMPGRIIGRTIDRDGKQGFTLTLQAREQHIRRAKATSNICTNQGLLVTAATIYMSLLGPEGLRRVALASYANTKALLELLLAIPGVTRIFNSPFFHEVVIRLPKPIVPVLAKMAAAGIQAGFDLSTLYPELENCLLVCVTETKSADDLKEYAKQLAGCL